MDDDENDDVDMYEYIDQYHYYGKNITLPVEVAFIYPWNLAVLAIFILLLFIYIGVCSKLPEDLYRSLALQHLLSGCLHVTCLTLYNLQLPIPYLNDIINEPYSCLDLVITFTTGCLAWIVFLRVFLFRNGEELYSMKQLAIFSTLFLAIIEVYEGLMDLVDLESDLISALRLTSVLLIMVVPVVVFILLLKSLLSTNSEVPKFQALFFMTYLLLFISSDVLLLRFNLYNKSSWLLPWSIFLFLRLVVGIAWYIVCDRYMSNFFIC